MIILRLVMKYLRKCKDPRAVTAVVVLVICMQIIFVGRRLGIEGPARAWYIGGVLLVGIVIIVLLTIREQKKKAEADQAEQSLLVDADSVVSSSPGAQQRAAEAARRELVEAIDALKGAKTEQGRSGRSALRDLPWLLVLGREKAGKSTIIRQSGLSVPGSRPGDRKRFQGVGPGHSCKWWFTNHAVILEANGRFVGDPDDTGEHADWHAVLDVLRKARPTVPLNGVIVTLSLADVIRHDTSTLDEQAHTLRRRLDACVKSLESYIPIYLIATKADLIHGFQEYFSDLEGNARDQILGATMSREQIEEEDPGAAFTREFETLYRSLCRRRIPRMERERVTADRAPIYLFPLEFRSLGPKLQRFVRMLCEPNPYGEKPMFRGFYFTSGAPEGRPVEMVVNEVSRVIGLPPELDGDADVTRFVESLPDEPSGLPEPEDSPRERACFLRELFTKLFLRDANLARPTERKAQKMLWRRRALHIGGLALLGLLATMFVVSFARNRGLVRETVEIAERTAAVPSGDFVVRDLEESLRQLEPLRSHLAELDDMDETGPPLSLSFGLYRGGAVNRSARAVYFDRFVGVLLGPSLNALANFLRTTHPALPAEYDEWAQNYYAYRMLIEPGRADPTSLAEWLTSFWWKSAFRDTATESFRELIRSHIQYAYGHPGDVRGHGGDYLVKDRLIEERARIYLRQWWKASTYYDAMVHRVNEQVPSFDLERVPGARRYLVAAAVDSTETHSFVPGAFTRDAWETIALEIETSEDRIRDDWILGEVFQGELPRIRLELVDRYRQEYAARWSSFLATVRVDPAPGVKQSIEDLRALADPSSPFVLLLDYAALNLQFSLPARNATRQDSVMVGVQEDYAALHALLAPSEDGTRPVDNLLAGLREIVAHLQEQRSSGDPGRTAADYAREMIHRPQGPIVESAHFSLDFTKDILRGSPQATSALQTLLGRPAEAAWIAVLREATFYLDDVWRSEVSERFQRTLAGNFPLSPGGPDASREEYYKFFQPSGILWGFFDAELAPFFERDLEPRPLLGHGLVIDEAAAAALRQARDIRDAVFTSDGALGFTFHVKPQQTSRVSGSPPAVVLSTLRVGDTSITYDMGRTWERPITWPADGASVGASLSLAVSGGPAPSPLEFGGEWGLFRLLQEAEIESDAARECRLLWTLRHDSHAIAVPYVARASSSVNPLLPGFLQYDCPRQLSPRTAPSPDAALH